MKDFLREHTFYNMMKQTYIDVLIINSKLSFMKTNSFETGLSDHHHTIYHIYIYIYIYIKQEKQKYKFWRQTLKSLDQRNWYTAISNNLIATNLNWRTQAAFENNFVYILDILDKHAPKKTNILRENKKRPILIRTFGSKWWLDHVSKTRQISQKNPSGIVKFKGQRNSVASLNK